MKKIKFKHRLALFEFICRYVIYSLALATMFFAFDAVMKHTIMNRIALFILIAVTIAFHIDSMKRLGHTMKNDKIGYKLFDIKRVR